MHHAVFFHGAKPRLDEIKVNRKREREAVFLIKFNTKWDEIHEEIALSKRVL